MSLIETAPSLNLPMDLYAERRVLGILIKYPDQIDQVAGRLKPGHFVDFSHRRIFEIILDIYHRQGKISYTQIYNRLRADNITDDPAELLIPLTESFVALSELGPSVQSLIFKEGMRRLLKAAEEIKALAWMKRTKIYFRCRLRPRN